MGSWFSRFFAFLNVFFFLLFMWPQKTREFVPEGDGPYSVILAIAVCPHEPAESSLVRCDRQRYETLFVTYLAAKILAPSPSKPSTILFFSMDLKIKQMEHEHVRPFSELKELLDHAQYIYCHQYEYVLSVLRKPYTDLAMDPCQHVEIRDVYESPPSKAAYLSENTMALWQFRVTGLFESIRKKVHKKLALKAVVKHNQEFCTVKSEDVATFYELVDLYKKEKYTEIKEALTKHLNALEQLIHAFFHQGQRLSYPKDPDVIHSPVATTSLS